MTSSPYPTPGDGADTRTEHLVTLLERSGRGEEAAFEELYGLCSAQLYGVILRILQSEAVAEEALQEACVKIWRKAGTYRREFGSPRTWMASIARNQAFDLLRRRGSREGHERTGLAGVLEGAADRTRPLEDSAADVQLLMSCLDGLTDSARDCILRAYCEGYSHEELAEAHGAPLGTVKSWIRRGLVSLRRCIDELS